MQKIDNLKLGIGFVLISTFLTSSQEAVFKFAGTQLDVSMSVWQLFVLRSAIIIPILVLLARNLRVLFDALKPWALARSFMFLCMYLTMYSTLPFLNLATIGACLYTAPLFVAMLSAVLLGEPINKLGLTAILIGFVGVLLVLQPGAETFTWLAIVPVFGGLFYAFSSIITRKKCRNTPPTALAMSLSIVLLIVSGLICAGFWLSPASDTNMSEWPFLFSPWIANLQGFEWALVLTLSMLMLGNGLVLPLAYQSAPTFIIATFDYCYLIFAVFFGYFLFAEVPNALTIIGMMMIAAAGLLSSRA